MGRQHPLLGAPTLSVASTSQAAATSKEVPLLGRQKGQGKRTVLRDLWGQRIKVRDG